MSRYQFVVRVPFEPLLRESIESSSVTQLPTGTFGSIEIEFDEPMYVIRRALVATDPVEAKSAGEAYVADLLKVLAASNDAFRVRPASISAEIVGSLASDAQGNHLFLSGHVGSSKRKGSLRSEVELVDRRSSWPDYLDDALELNYLAVISERPMTRWLLATIALERLTEGRLGPRARLIRTRLGSTEATGLLVGITGLLEAAGLEESDVVRLRSRILDTEVRPAAEQIANYLTQVGVEYDLGEPVLWWRRRGNLAHGQIEADDVSALSRLVSRTQEAIRNELVANSAEPIA